MKLGVKTFDSEIYIEFSSSSTIYHEALDTLESTLELSDTPNDFCLLAVDAVSPLEPDHTVELRIGDVDSSEV